ncbi:MAG: orotidine-5'-phosphate decarboxylase [Gemmatimonadetes bacterium]|nr:orotidine-5'-phosphate decarboxylase [Gemmatimonadota bacterium]
MGPLPEVIVALDLASAADALSLVDTLGARVAFYKVGLELYTGGEAAVVEALRDRGKRVFLDLKYHDIPTTVAAAVDGAARLGVEMATVHVAGGRAMLAAARQAAARRVRLLGVTVLTSLTVADLVEVWGRRAVTPAREVVRLGRLAADSGLDGAVASAFEAAELKKACGPGFLVVTPGIRLVGGERHDQRRVATPAAAARAGADYLVIGRAVTGAPDPVAAVERVYADLEEVRARS